MANIESVLQMIQDNDVKFVDLRFTDIKGKEQHVSIPARAVDEDWFEEGQPFDGSSMDGWKGIEASDMILIADPDSARLDPFREESTLILTCDATDPATGNGYNRDPRSIAKRAEAYLKSTGIGDTAFFGPEPEFHIFDSIVWGTDPEHSFYKIGSDEAGWASKIDYEQGNLGHRPGHQGGYFPVPPIDSFQDMRAEMCLLMEQQGVPVEVQHHEVGAGQCEIGTRFNTLVKRADWTQIVNLYAQARGGQRRLRHARSPIHLERRSKPFRRQRLRGLKRHGALLHRRCHQARQGVKRDHKPDDQFLQAPGAGL